MQAGTGRMRIMLATAIGAAAMAAQAVTNGPVQEIVVSATRLSMPAKDVASAVTVIDAATIERRQNQTAVEILRQDVPGLDVVQNGGVGSTASVYIRGCKPEHVLVLIDGVDANDPASAGRSFEWANLAADNIERIEVLRGPQSTLYGSDAIGGVVNIVTRKGQGAPHGSVRAEYGSHNSFSGKTELSGSTGAVNYAVGLGQIYTEGISAASEKNGNTEKDGYQATTLSGRFGWDPTPRHSADLIVRYNTAWQQYDDFDYTTGLPTDAASQGKYQTLTVRAQGAAKFFDDKWEQLLGFSLADSGRNDTTATSDSSFDGRTLGASWQNNLAIIDDHILTFGVDLKQETAESVYESTTSVDTFEEQSAEMSGVYLQDSFKIGEAVDIAAGLRYDDHSQSGGKLTGRIAPQYRIKATGTRIKGTYGTGFKAPSLFQLYSTYGNSALQAEESQGWDAGVEQELGSADFTAEVTWFGNRYDNMIDYDYSTSKYMNTAKAKSDGVEAALNLKPHKRLELRFNYTYTETENETTGLTLLRRPRNKAGMSLNWKPIDKLNLGAAANYVGVRRDQDFTTSTSIDLEDYMLVNLSGSYDITSNFQLFARVSNVFNESYEEVYGYGTMGVAGYGGVKVSF